MYLQRSHSSRHHIHAQSAVHCRLDFKHLQWPLHIFLHPQLMSSWQAASTYVRVVHTGSHNNEVYFYSAFSCMSSKRFTSLLPRQTCSFLSPFNFLGSIHCELPFYRRLNTNIPQYPSLSVARYPFYTWVG